jgi:hypothetical protein
MTEAATDSPKGNPMPSYHRTRAHLTPKRITLPMKRTDWLAFTAGAVVTIGAMAASFVAGMIFEEATTEREKNLKQRSV